MKISFQITILLISGLLFPRQTSAQKNNDLEIIKTEVTNLFKNADKLKLQNVLPFKVNNKTGLVDAQSKKIILNPTEDLTDVTLFNPTMKGLYKKQYFFEIFSDKFGVEISETLNPEPPDIDALNDAKKPKVEVISSKTGYKGFNIDEKGNLISYSDLYIAQYNFIHVQPFLFKGKFYAIATIKTGPDEYFDGIIDTAGNPLPHFNFQHKCICKIKEGDDDIWFSVDNCRELKGSLISFNGKNKLKGELVGWAVYPTLDIFKYNVNYSRYGKVSGILDVDALEWIVKPQGNLKILRLDYTSENTLDVRKLEERKNAKIYFWVEDGNKAYYVDFKMKKYFPYQQLKTTDNK
jgi:hypothetical protein